MLPIFFVTFIVCFLIEQLNLGWKLPKVPTWPIRVIVLNIFQLLVVLLAGITWEKWFQMYSLFHLSNYVNEWLGGFIAYFIGTFVFYWWHRWRHTVDFFWKHFHQIHHSPQRIEVITSFYKHPLEMTINSLIGCTIVYTILGLNIEGGSVFTLCCTLGEFVYHTNIKTPQWLGYIFQRPEMHRIHHEYNKHSNNYGDFVWWDMLFGTYENPKEFKTSCGFDHEKEERLIDMLKFKDVHKE
jgi:sterol desaturase/sphingolipid hydroxylase (fatty acid hydroxylase superfamily)